MELSLGRYEGCFGRKTAFFLCCRWVASVLGEKRLFFFVLPVGGLCILCSPFALCAVLIYCSLLTGNCVLCTLCTLSCFTGTETRRHNATQQRSREAPSFWIFCQVNFSETPAFVVHQLLSSDTKRTALGGEYHHAEGRCGTDAGIRRQMRTKTTDKRQPEHLLQHRT